ncbi:MAG: fatty acid desaturase family protein [Paracoccaceae bacterium]
MRRFVGMTKYTRSGAWLIVSFYLALIFAGIYVGHYLLSLPLTVATVALMVLTAFFIGTRLRGLNNIVHECTHSSFSDHREDNVRIGKFCSSFLTGCFKTYKDGHLSHHAHLGDYENDKEMAAIEKFRLHEPLTVPTILRHIATPLLGRHLKMYSGISLSGGDGAFFFGLKIVILIAISLFSIFYPYTSIFFVLLPLFYIFPTLNFWTDCLDHAGIVGEEDELEASRNVLAPQPLRLLFFPRNDCFHLVHHLFPQVPARHLETAHEELSEDPVYRNQPLAVRPTHRSLTGFATDIS